MPRRAVRSAWWELGSGSGLLGGVRRAGRRRDPGAGVGPAGADSPHASLAQAVRPSAVPVNAQWPGPASAPIMSSPCGRSPWRGCQDHRGPTVRSGHADLAATGSTLSGALAGPATGQLTGPRWPHRWPGSHGDYRHRPADPRAWSAPPTCSPTPPRRPLPEPTPTQAGPHAASASPGHRHPRFPELACLGLIHSSPAVATTPGTTAARLAGPAAGVAYGRSVNSPGSVSVTSSTSVDFRSTENLPRSATWSRT